MPHIQSLGDENNASPFQGSLATCAHDCGQFFVAHPHFWLDGYFVGGFSNHH